MLPPAGDIGIIMMTPMVRPRWRMEIYIYIRSPLAAQTKLRIRGLHVFSPAVLLNY